MALLFIEGFDAFPLMDFAWTQVYKWSELDVDGFLSNDASIVEGRDGGKCLVLQSPDGYVSYITDGERLDVVAGYARWDSTGDRTLFNISPFGNGGTHIRLTVTNSGTDLNIFTVDSGSPDATSAGALIPNVWQYIEVKLHIDNVSGSYEVKVDGVTKMSNSGIDTKSSQAFVTGTWISFTSGRIDDIYICDNTGAQNNDFLGDCSVTALQPNGDVIDEWGATGSPHYDELADNVNGTYVETGSPDAVELFDFENETTLLGGIFGIEVCGQVLSTSDPVDLRIVSGATTSDAEGRDNTVRNDPGYITFTRIVELDPNTSSAWTLSNLNAAQFGAILGS